MTCNLQGIEYGSVSLANVPVKAKASLQPMYADNGITLKYYKTTILVEFVFTVPQSYTDTNGHTSADDYIDSVRDVLNTPGLPLIFSYRGLGKAFETANADIVYGPYPKVTEWEPLGSNQSVKVTWIVDFATLKCPLACTFSTNGPTRFQILQLVDDMNLSYDHDGAVVINTNGTIEIAFDEPNAAFFTPKTLKDFVAWFLPNSLNGFNRTVEATLRKDRRTVDYRVTDTELKTDNALFPYMVSQDVTHSISSSLLNSDPFSGAGFRTWVNDLNGTFHVRPGIWKGWAYIAFLNVMAQRRDRASPTQLDKLREAIDGNTNLTTGDGDAARKDRKKIRPRQIPLFISIREKIFGREVTLSSKWITLCSLNQLFKATGMFYPVDSKFVGNDLKVKPVISGESPDVPETPSVQWGLWRTQLTDIQSLSGYRGVNPPNFEITFNQCETPTEPFTDIRLEHTDSRSTVYLTQNPFLNFDSGWEYYEASEGTGRVAYSPDGEDVATGFTSPYLEGLTPDASWIKYHNGFELLEQTNSTYVPTTGVGGVSSLNVVDPSNTYRDQKDFKIQSGETPEIISDYNNDVIQTFGKPVYKIRMKGYALRVGYQIPCPSLVSVTTKQGVSAIDTNAYRVGNQKWKHQLLEASDQVPVYLAVWDQVYAIATTPESEYIKFNTSGNPAEFA